MTQNDDMRLFDIGWRSMLVGGAMSVALGVLVAAWPNQTALVVGILFGLQLIFWGLMLIAGSLAAGGGAATTIFGTLGGAFALLAGVISLRSPGRTIVLLGLVLGAGWILSGVFDVVDAAADEQMGSRGWTAFAGMVSILAGAVVMSFPTSSLGALAIWAGILMVMLGIMRIFLAFDLRNSAPATAV